MSRNGRSPKDPRPQGAAVERRFWWGLFEEGCRRLFKAYFRAFHRIRVEGMEHVPEGFHRLIVIANHASLIDGILVWTYLRLPFKIVVDRTVARKLLFRPFMRNRHTVQIDSMSPYALKEVIRWVSEGTPLLIFPEGRMTITGALMKIYEGTGFVALKAGAELLPLYLKGTYATFFAKKHRGRKLFAPIAITVGRIRPPLGLDHLVPRERKKEATRRVAHILSETYLDAHNKPSTLGREFIRKCKENGRRPLYDDAIGHGVSYRKALVTAFVLGRSLSRMEEKHVGLMLPNLTVTALIFMGLQLFRKTPALLNYSSGPAALRHAMDLADLGVIITSRAFLERVHVAESILEGRRVIFLEDLPGLIRRRDKIWGLAQSIFPGANLRIGPEEHKETACILFTSGSEGMPKGVCLSHENLITNVYQALSRIDVTAEDYFFGALPLFHAFGLTVGALIPPFLNARAFFYVNPLHYRIVPELVYQKGCTILCGTNTFLKGYARRANAYDFSSIHYIYCGAEPLGEEVFREYAEKFGVRVMAGYGLTECSPVVSINTDLEYAYGTVGAMLPGMEHKLMPVEGIDHKGGTVGKLFVRGKNVMKGYLKNEKANHRYLVEDEGWYDTGDVVEITPEGFLRIVGRLKRFAKISGEMISLAAVEEALTAVFGERKPLAVIARPDELRGEKLVVVTNNPEVSVKAAREVLRQRGFSDLASPRDVLFVREVPKLGSGKIDYVRLAEIVMEG